MDIKEMRAASGITQTKICQLTGVPTRTWRSWEKSERECPPYVKFLIEYFLTHENILKST